MGKCYSHLTYNDRLHIARMLDKGYKVSEIANVVGKSEVTIYAEIKRARYIHTNHDLTETEKYNPDRAQELYEWNLKGKGPGLKIDKDHELAQYIETKIIDDNCSPYAALQAIKQDGKTFQVEIKSVNTIYAYIRKGVFRHLSMAHLPIKEKSRGKQKVKRARKASRGTSIEKRPEAIAKREEFGHWEMDCVIGKRENRKTLLVLTERKTRYELIEVLKRHNVDEVRKALNRLEKRFQSDFYSIFKTITVDNGAEFSDPDVLEKALYRVGKRTKMYFCHPYCSCERGTNENQNKLIRRHYPKGTDFDIHINKKKVTEVQNWMNHYPRRILNGQTPAMRFAIECKKLLRSKQRGAPAG